ncbi:MAG: dihydroorotate dehydrogenase electron transfer subunit [bacterium]|nr:dihydroorotate dehydrogenase electron transfer subunit [bacterium]
MEFPLMLRIEKIVDEAKDTKTFVFKHKLGAKPGQFVNVWIPGVDEKPFSISYQDKEKFAVTVMKIGPYTRKMFALKKGDSVGIRGPYGKGFSMKGKNILVVGGGCGCAPLAFLVDKLPGKITYVMGARDKESLMFVKRMSKKAKVVVATDDGSVGRKGYATDAAEEVLKSKKVDFVYSCGPEIMMKKLLELCNDHHVTYEASLERYMKCGFGVCGQCCIDGIRVCKDGPVFDRKTLNSLQEFGKYKRDSTGKKVPL